MTGRRIAIALSVLVAVIIIANAISDRAGRDDRAVAPAPRPPGTAPAVIRGELPEQRVVRATVGDAVSISVRPPTPDTVTIDALGVEGDATPELPGTLDFVATSPGRFEVTLRATGEDLGAVLVSPAEGDGGVAAGG